MASLSSKFVWITLFILLGICLTLGEDNSTTPTPTEAAEPEEPLQCYVCDSSKNSSIGEQCNDVFVTNGTEVPLVNCTRDAEPADGDPKYQDDTPRCFKTVNILRDAKELTEYEIVVRGCGKFKSNICKVSKSPAGSYEVCHCDTHGCNGAGLLRVDGVIALIVLTLAAGVVNSVLTL